MKEGYCNWCANNADHGRYSSSVFAAAFHALVRMMSGGSSYGPWYCSECRRVSKLLNPPVESHTIRQVGHAVGGNESVAHPMLHPRSPEDTVVTLSSESTQRFSQKYRNAIARKILDGSSTFKQVSEELSISKKEAWSWLVELSVGERQQIVDLKNRVRQLESRLGEVSKEDGPVDPWDSDVVNQWSSIVVGAQLDVTNEAAPKTELGDS
jgi:hypothetical protein